MTIERSGAAHAPPIDREKLKRLITEHLQRYLGAFELFAKDLTA